MLLRHGVVLFVVVVVGMRPIFSYLFYKRVEGLIRHVCTYVYMQSVDPQSLGGNTSIGSGVDGFLRGLVDAACRPKVTVLGR